jgi:hypothetical protein
MTKSLVVPFAAPLFCDRIRDEFVTGSAIAPDLFEAAVRFIDDTGFYEPNEALGHRVSRFWQSRKPHHFGSIAAFVNEDGSLWQAKPENPMPRKDGSLPKYEYPVGVGAKAYLPPMPPAIRQTIARRWNVDVPMSGSFWEWLEQHPEVPVVVTEGGKKALALFSLGFVAIALVGVNGGVQKYDKVAGDRIQKLQPELVPGLKELAIPDRHFILAFDQDEKKQTRDRVQRALFDLSFWLERAGASAAIAQWQSSEGKGVDDLIVGQGSDRWQQVYQEALPAALVKAMSEVANRVTRTPDLYIGLNEFIHHIDSLPISGILALLGGKGTAKGKAIAALLKRLGLSWLSITSLRSLGRDQAAGWDGVLINEGDQCAGHFLHNGQPATGLVTCIPSLLKVKSFNADVLLLDELPAIADFLLSSHLANKNGIRPLLIEELERRIREAKLVIFASADLSNRMLSWVESIRGDRAFLVRSDRKPLNYPVHWFNGSKMAVMAQYLSHQMNVPAGKLTIFHTDSKRQAEQVAAYLRLHGQSPLLITSETSGGEIESAFLQSKGRDLSSLLMMGITCIITSPSVKEGFSIEFDTHLIDSVWGIFDGCSITAESMAQTCDRVRSAEVPRYLWVAERGRAYSRLSRSESVSGFIREFQRSSAALIQLTRSSLKSETVHQVDGLDWNNPHVLALADLQVQRNRGMRQLRIRVEALLRHEGKQILYCSPSLSDEQIRSIIQDFTAIRQQLDLERAIAIEGMVCPTDVEAEVLMRKEALTPGDALKLERYFLEKFYQASVDRHLVLWDRQGNRRSQIRHLEYLLDAKKAESRTVQSIQTNPNTPQDWVPTALQRFIFEESGALELVLKIWRGEIVELTEELIQPIALFLKHHSQDIKLAFNFSNINTVSDRQAVFLLLDWCGIQRCSRRRRVEGRPIRRYFVDMEHLSKLKAIFERRCHDDPPVHIVDINEGGGSLGQTRPIDEQWDEASLGDIRQMWESAQSTAERDVIRQLFSDAVIQRAIAS